MVLRVILRYRSRGDIRHGKRNGCEFLDIPWCRGRSSYSGRCGRRLAERPSQQNGGQIGAHEQGMMPAAGVPHHIARSAQLASRISSRDGHPEAV